MSLSSSKALGPKEEDWEQHRSEIQELYVGQEWSLRQVMKHMEEKYSFVAKKNQFEKYLHHKWKLAKNLPSSTWAAIALHVHDFERAGKNAEVLVRGIKKSPVTIRRQTTRNRHAGLGKLPNGVIVREAPTQLLPQMILKLPFHAFRDNIRNTLGLIPMARHLGASSNQLAMGSRTRDVWSPEAKIEQALQAVVPLDPTDTAAFLNFFPRTWSNQPFSSQLHQNIFFSVTNNFAGLSSSSPQPVIDFLQRETSVGLYHLIRSSREYYTAQAVALNLFREAIEAGDAMTVNFLLSESWPGIEVNSFICSYPGKRRTPIERAASLLHKDVIQVLLRHGADVTKSDPEKPWPDLTKGALNCAVCDLGEDGRPGRSPKLDPGLFRMLVEAGGKLNPVNFINLIEKDISGHCVRLIVERYAAEDHESWAKQGIFCHMFRFMDHETLLEILDTMLQIGADLNCPGQEDTYAKSIIDMAASRGDLNLVQSLLREGAKLTGDTLPCAISSGNISIVQHLLNVGAKIDAMGSLRISPLAAAIRSQDKCLVALIVNQKGLDSLGISEFFQSALEASSEVGDAEWIRCLVNIGGDIRPEDLSVALSICTQKGQRDVALELIDAGANCNRRSSCPAGPPLFEALKRQDSVLVRALLNADANVNYSVQHIGQGASITPAIGLAVIWGDHSIIHDVLQAGANADDFCRYEESGPALNIAIARRDKKTVDLLLDNGCSINNPAARLYGKTALQAAVNTGDQDLIAYVLDRGADPHDPEAITDAAVQSSRVLFFLLRKHVLRYPQGQKGWGGQTLMLAYKKGDYDLFKKLLEAGADANQIISGNTEFVRMSPEGTTAFGHIISGVRNDDVKFVELLLNSPGQPGCRPETMVSRVFEHRPFNRFSLASVTAFLAAIGSGNMATIKLMLRHGADVNFPAKLGIKRTPLQRAVELGNMQIVELLLQHAADVNAPASERGGGTTLQLAAHGGFIPIFRLLRQHGANLDAPASKVNGRSPLEGASEMGRLDMVAELLKSGAASQGRDTGQLKRAISFAEKNCHFPIVDMLNCYVRNGRVSDGPPVYDEFLNLDEMNDEDVEGW